MVDEFKTADEARLHCANEGGYLVTFPTGDASRWFRTWLEAEVNNLGSSVDSGKICLCVVKAFPSVNVG